MITGIADSGQKIITDGLVLHLDAAQLRSYPGTGTTWTDLSGNGNTGTLTNGPTFNSSNGGAIVFDASNDYVGLGTPASLNLMSTLTVSSFVKFNTLSAGNFYTIYEKGYNSPNDQTFFRIHMDGSNRLLQIGTYNDGAGDKKTSFNINSLNTDTWYNFVGQYDGANWRLYINGNLESTTLTNQGPYSSTAPIAVGAAWIVSSYTRVWNGSIANCLVYNRALTATEILQNYNAVKSRFGL